MKSAAWNETNWRGRFFTVWGGQAFSLLGSQIVQFALIWWLTERTGSATVLAMASLVGFLPTIVLGPFAGTLVDRWNRRAVMLAADTFIALATLVLAVLFALEIADVWTIFILLFVRALGGGFHQPAMTASTSLMVPDDQLTRVAGLNQMLQGGLAIVAAPLGALLIELFPIQSILMIDVVTALFAVLPLLFITIPQPKKNGIGGEASAPSFWTEFREGFRYLVSWRGLLYLSIFVTLINLVMAPSGALFPLLVTDHFGGGALQLGWLQASFGVGIVLGGLLLGIWGGFKRRIFTSLFGLIALGIAYGSLGLIPGEMFGVAVTGAFFGGFTLPFVNGPVRAIMQSTVEPAMQGRIFTLLGSFATGMIPLGLIIAGPVADALGVTTWYVIAGAGCALLGVAALFTPAVLNIEEERKSKDQIENLEVAVEEV